MLALSQKAFSQASFWVADAASTTSFYFGFQKLGLKHTSHRKRATVSSVLPAILMTSAKFPCPTPQFKSSIVAKPLFLLPMANSAAIPICATRHSRRHGAPSVCDSAIEQSKISVRCNLTCSYCSTPSYSGAIQLRTDAQP